MVRWILGLTGAAIALVLGWPVIKLVLTGLLSALMLVGCVIALTVATPFYLVGEAPAIATRAAAEKTALAVHATLEASPLPSNVEVLAEMGSLRWWSLSPSEQHVVFLNDGYQDRLGILDLTTGQVQWVHPLNPVACRFGGREVYMGYSLEAWLDENRLLFAQLPCGDWEDSYRVLNLKTGADFELHSLRGDALTASALVGRDLFRIDPRRVVAIDDRSGLAVQAYNEYEQQQFAAQASEREINPAVRTISFGVSAEWINGQAYPSPNAAYQALWENEGRLAILGDDGGVLNETFARAFGPPPADCGLMPLRWLSDSSGVIFWAGCGYASRPVARGVLLLSAHPQK